jgi:hypothetical protein
MRSSEMTMPIEKDIQESHPLWRRILLPEVFLNICLYNYIIIIRQFLSILVIY